MATIETYRKYYAPVDPNNDDPKCMDDRLDELGLQTPAEVMGVALDIDTALRAKGQDVDLDEVTELTLALFGVDLWHEGICAGRVKGPATHRLVASHDPNDIFRGVGSFGLNLSGRVVERTIDTSLQLGRTGLTVEPDIEAAVGRLGAQGIQIVRRRPPIGERLHEAKVIISNTSEGFQFDPAKAWNAGDPAYNIDSARSARRLHGLLGLFNVTPQEYQAALAIRSVVTAVDALRVPGTDMVPEVLVFAPSFARED